jgi:hypothetical protein
MSVAETVSGDGWEWGSQSSAIWTEGDVVSSGRGSPSRSLYLVASREVPVEPTVDVLDRIIDRWVELAMRHSRVRKLSGTWVADVAGVDGAWIDGRTKKEAIGELPEVLREWVVMKLEDGDQDIPPMEGVKLVIDR